jgi:hypothetical protein
MNFHGHDLRAAGAYIGKDGFIGRLPSSTAPLLARMGAELYGIEQEARALDAQQRCTSDERAPRRSPRRCTTGS